MWRSAIRRVSSSTKSSSVSSVSSTASSASRCLARSRASTSLPTSFLQRQQRGRHSLASSGAVLGDTDDQRSLQRRTLSSQKGGGIEDDEELDSTDLMRSRMFTASDMEFFNDPKNADEMLNSAIPRDDDDMFGDDGEDDAEAFKQSIQLELDNRTGRCWSDPWELTDEDWMSTKTYEDMLDWSPEYISRIAQERVQVHPDGILTLETMANLKLPAPVGPLPGKGQAKAYALYRGRQIRNTQIRPKVIELASPRVERIRKLQTWQDKQDAVDELFESIESELRQSEEILGLHPNFGYWVERSLEEYLKDVSKEATAVPTEVTEAAETTEAVAEDKKEAADADESDELKVLAPESDEDAVPIFMDCVNAAEAALETPPMVPSILTPLTPHPYDGAGRMVEEWELSARPETKRIMLRQCTRSIAQSLVTNDVSRIYVHGERGVGKSAALTAIVASARSSGHIVLYLPDGDRFRKNGFYITPNKRREGMFDLPDLSQEVCTQLLNMHSGDLEGMEAGHDKLEASFTPEQIEKIEGYSGSGMSVVDLLKHAAESKAHASMCYSVVLDHLMNQDQKPFLMVLDQFNCYFDHGQYFHMSYDDDVRDPVPHDRITLFEPALKAMTLRSDENDLDETSEPTVMKRGGIIVCTTEAHAVPRKVTDNLLESAKRRSSQGEAPIQIIPVTRYSDLEADHILANFESTGIGKLRLDRGDTLLDEGEVAYLKMLSGKIGQQLLDASIV